MSDRKESKGSSLYKALDNSRNEIRLVTISTPTPGSKLLHLTLAHYCLDDLTHEYRNFESSTNGDGRLHRGTVSQWAAQFQQRESPSGLPPEGAERFEWGDYATLSYVWGSEQRQRPIILNGRKFSVTENLEIALRALSRSGHHGGTYRLWIDALCIDQSNEAERAEEVARMRDIYSGAYGVIAWLGEEGEYSGDAFDLLERFAAMAGESRAKKFGDLALPTSFFFGNGFSGLNALMSRAYWTRLWIVQEVVLGASAAVLHCGDRLMAWRTFSDAVDVLFRSDLWLIKDHLLQTELDRRGVDGDGTWSTLWLHLVHKDLRPLSRYHELNEGPPLGLRRLLDIACSSRCRDRRDKVFALLGMMDPAIARSLVQDYTSDSAGLYTTVSKAFITHHGNLEPLREGNPWGKSNAPSWAADWTWDGRLRYSRPENPVWGFWQLSDQTAAGCAPETVYSAAGTRAAEFRFDGESSLVCKGFVFDRVAGLGALGRGYFRWESKAMVQFRTWKSAYGGNRETAAAIYKTLLLNRVNNGRPAEPQHAAILSLPKTFDVARPQFERHRWRWMASQEGYYFRWSLWREANDRLRLGEQRLGDYFTDSIPQGAEEEVYAEVYGAFDRTSKERRFMLTNRGYMGWAPDNIRGSKNDQTRQGDLICILFGCSTPLVIRPCGRRYQIVGEAYVEGFMNGQAMELLKTDPERVSVQDFTFC